MDYDMIGKHDTVGMCEVCMPESGFDCLIDGLACLILGLDCLIYGLDCLIYGLDCLVGPNLALTVSYIP